MVYIPLPRDTSGLGVILESKCGLGRFGIDIISQNMVSYICWLGAQNRLQTKDKLLRLHIITEGKCDLCQCDDKDLNHLICQCPFSLMCWKLLEGRLGMNFSPSDCRLLGAKLRRLPLLRKHIAMALVCAVFYHVWLNRNCNRVYGFVYHPEQIIQQIWVNVRNKVRRCTDNISNEDVNWLRTRCLL